MNLRKSKTFSNKETSLAILKTLLACTKTSLWLKVPVFFISQIAGLGKDKLDQLASISSERFGVLLDQTELATYNASLAAVKGEEIKEGISELTTLSTKQLEELHRLTQEQYDELLITINKRTADVAANSDQIRADVSKLTQKIEDIINISQSLNHQQRNGYAIELHSKPISLSPSRKNMIWSSFGLGKKSSKLSKYDKQSRLVNYYSIYNQSNQPIIINKFHIEVNEGDVIWDLKLPRDFSKRLLSGECLHIGFERNAFANYIIYELKCSNEFIHNAVFSGPNNTCFRSQKLQCWLGSPRSLGEDPNLNPHLDEFAYRNIHVENIKRSLIELFSDADSNRNEHSALSSSVVANMHKKCGLFRINKEEWLLREFAPNAKEIFFLRERDNYQYKKNFSFKATAEKGIWELALPSDQIKHKECYRLLVRWEGNQGERIPVYSRRVLQNSKTGKWYGQAWEPKESYIWKHKSPQRHNFPLIYQAHVGIAQDKQKIGQFDEFISETLPRIQKAGYNTLLLMAVIEHPYYPSLGYHTTNLFAPSSRFGSPEELKELIDEAHGLGLSVLLDLPHAHTAVNEIEGLGNFDGSYLYCHKDEERREHPMWGSLCYDYSKTETLLLLLSCCKYWMEEFKIDGYRFDGVTSMLYKHHGENFSKWTYRDYFDRDQFDLNAFTYLKLANELIHKINTSAITIAEDVSGYPGLATPIDRDGCGFDYRLAMGIPDFWQNVQYESVREWDLVKMWGSLTNRHGYENTISYVECHDQCINGKESTACALLGKDIYNCMAIGNTSERINYGTAIHKVMRAVTLITANGGYLNFIGNEFGHPDGVELPCKKNNNSLKCAYRQWNLRDNDKLMYWGLAEWDKSLMNFVMKCDSFVTNAPEQCFIEDDENKVILISRRPVLCVINFNSEKTLNDYQPEAPPGRYVLKLNSDDEQFGGNGIIKNPQPYFTFLNKNNQRNYLQGILIPPLTCLILEGE